MKHDQILFADRRYIFLGLQLEPAPVDFGFARRVRHSRRRLDGSHYSVHGVRRMFRHLQFEAHTESVGVLDAVQIYNGIHRNVELPG